MKLCTNYFTFYIPYKVKLNQIIKYICKIDLFKQIKKYSNINLQINIYQTNKRIKISVNHILLLYKCARYKKH